jgi:uncharacterized protein with ParB-like and HNH nuclease domain
MSQTLFSTTDYPLSKLIEDIDLGEIALPDIQRPFVWKTAKVRDLFDSMYKGFPIGYLLFWRYDQGEARQIGIGEKQNVPRLLVVDGQQRLTSLYAVMKDRPVLDEDYQERELKSGNSTSLFGPQMPPSRWPRRPPVGTPSTSPTSPRSGPGTSPGGGT